MPRFLAVMALAIGLLSACGKKPAATVDVSATPTDAKPAGVPEDAAAAGSAATLERLTQALRKFSAENQRVPKNLKELVDKGYLPELPGAGAGRTFIINEKSVRVELSNP